MAPTANTTLKRKAESEAARNPSTKKRNTSDIRKAFRDDLFEPQTVKSFHDSYTTSEPYPHAVVSGLIQEDLLRNVRSEITENIHFTLKETDIYRIHQSGDLANLSNLDQEALKRLPSLVKLRDALYSPDFREWVSEVTGAGKLSGRKTDMAVNVYTPGSYLLCHDDVIGSRRVSYILYLTDPDNPWQAEWGGGLRLYPTEPKKNRAGEDIKVPLAEWNVNIPPSFSQLSFFAVRPGESYHDVEEVYHAKDAQDDKCRIRMAVSGWFHIPQEGEHGFEAGVEEAQAQKSSLAQLQGAADEFDEPQTSFRHFDEPRAVANAQATGTEQDPGDEDDQDETLLTEQDLTFLLQYITPGFLVPDKLEELADSFEETSMLQLDAFLAEKFTKDLKPYIERIDQPAFESYVNPWPIARPPHKHRFAYLTESTAPASDYNPISQLLNDLLHSHAFKKWLALATGLQPSSLMRQHALARRFRAGGDYALANTYTGEQPRLEFTINLTPSTGWEREDPDAADPPAPKSDTNGKHKPNTNGAASSSSSKDKDTLVNIDRPEYGGEEIYMAADDDDASTHSKALPSVGRKSRKYDPAVYQSNGNDAEDDDGGILFTNAPAWNTFCVVLRDKGTMRFVKYVSQAARSDRWDVKGEIELAENAFDGEGGVDDDDADLGELGEDDVEEEVEFEEGEDEDEDEDVSTPEETETT
ncbi:putative component of NuA3 histone acetyltransferase complex [Exophiala xenobiotica]|uniref:Component of NuA3 histone acetyltransferase complex n=1 Tax=Lithohypha guttulata TaxID=1690604 RepID=A0ABR0K4J9_9EURO|nr:putative component of NuA3 histone acetyltransferase complex [Lithohypha guttulata]KAK5330921.1 putative component of NuA3 histone acetyltransferase complex [Exophiala xenobiotica]